MLDTQHHDQCKCANCIMCAMFKELIRLQSAPYQPSLRSHRTDEERTDTQTQRDDNNVTGNSERTDNTIKTE